MIIVMDSSLLQFLWILSHRDRWGSPFGSGCKRILTAVSVDHDLGVLDAVAYVAVVLDSRLSFSTARDHEREAWWRNLSLVIAMFVFACGTREFPADAVGIWHGILLVLHRQWQEFRKRMDSNGPVSWPRRSPGG